jgi:hypothetical protein
LDTAPGIVICACQGDHPGYDVAAPELLQPLVGPVCINTVEKVRCERDGVVRAILAGVEQRGLKPSSGETISQSLGKKAVAAMEGKCVGAHQGDARYHFISL